MLEDIVRRAFGHDLAAVYARTRADIQHGISGTDGFFIVFHHQHGIAEIAQVFQRGQQPRVVALMQAYGRFVEDVHDAGQARAHLAGETDALRFAARQGLGAAIQRQVVEAHIDQETQPVAHFLDDLVGHFRTPAGHIQ